MKWLWNLYDWYDTVREPWRLVLLLIAAGVPVVVGVAAFVGADIGPGSRILAILILLLYLFFLVLTRTYHLYVYEEKKG